VFNQPAGGSQRKWLWVVKDYAGKRLTRKVDNGITSEKLTDRLLMLFATRGRRKHIRCDNGSKLSLHCVEELQPPHNVCSDTQRNIPQSSRDRTNVSPQSCHV
jgi:hypothetical protein